ncbi:penicillin-binding protein 2 [Candidatus Kaiserbacteria bacterium]|nr:penicillin-binding protein 2 [Candidatus Kaiserbacteria bacterium]
MGRARFLSALFILAALLLVARLYFVQIVHGEQYRKSALGQYVADVRDTEDRGIIFFKEKDGDLVAAALMQGGWRIAIAPKEIADPEDVFAKLSFAGVDRERFFASVSKKDDPYEEVGFRVSDRDAEQIRAQKIPGVLLVQDQWRSYPAGRSGVHVVGFVGYQGDRRVGVYGLERSYNETLTKWSTGLYVNPFAEIFTNIGAAVAEDPAEGYGNLITSIEPQVQARLEETLDSVMQTYSPKAAGGIVMDPRTGEIVAMAGRPAFDPNTYNTADVSVFGNLLVENVYEMGSIMKPLTVATGIDVAAVTPETLYEDRGCIEKSGKKICNYDGKARGVVNVQEVLNQSLNVGASFIESRIGHNVFGEYVHAFGLGEKTGIDLPNEASGLISSIDRGYDVDYASASFGQGIAVTGVEMIRALAALANDGVLPSPHIVTAIKLESGIVREVEPQKGPRVLKPETVQTVSDMLVKVFDNALLGGILKQEHYSIAAKTGTAQIALPRGGGYYEDRYLHSFFGYFPAHEPEYIVFLIAIEPHGAQFASATLARPFLDIAKYLINYYDIPPDR